MSLAVKRSDRREQAVPAAASSYQANARTHLVCERCSQGQPRPALASLHVRPYPTAATPGASALRRNRGQDHRPHPAAPTAPRGPEGITWPPHRPDRLTEGDHVSWP